MRVSACVGILVLFAGLVPATELLSVTFNGSPLGKYTTDAAAADFGRVTFTDGIKEGRAQIVSNTADTDRWLRVTYPAGKLGPSDSGVQIYAPLSPNNLTELYVSYRVRVGGSTGTFDFTRGGKLPGLCGGDCPTGGALSKGGFSARMMWRPQGAAVQYMYLPGSTADFGVDWPWDASGATRAFPLNQWVTVQTKITLNTFVDVNGFSGKVAIANGALQSWWNGALALDRRGLTLRSIPTVGISVFYFSTFFGGSEAAFKPPATYVIDFDDIVVSTLPVRPPAPTTPPLPAPTPTAKPTTAAPKKPTTAAPLKPTTAAPTKPTPAPAASCTVSVAVEKVKEYYVRVTPTPIALVSAVYLSDASPSGNRSAVRMTYGFSDYDCSTSKTVSDRNLVVVLVPPSSAPTSVRVEVYRVPFPSNLPEGALLTCVATGGKATAAAFGVPLP